MLENLERIVDRSEVLNGVQKLYIKSLSKDIGEAQSYEDGFRLVSNFRNQVIQSEELTENDRLLLIELAAGSEALLEFIENGGGQMIQKQFANNISHPPFGRLAGCSVNWRGVWMDGVVGLVGGAVYGGYIGATAGTFTVPILGTVAGGVGGAVFGGASGFISGVTYGIASNLLTSCFRPSLVQSYATCDSAWDAFMNNQTSNLPKQCFEVSVSFK
jgi:hypothetical protein